MSTLCRFCSAHLTQTLVDLGSTPLANSYLPDAEAIKTEVQFPLHVMVCNACWLAQTTETVSPDAIFDHDYAYLSSYSAGWVAHAKDYATEMAAKFGLNEGSQVVEIASNDGYLLQHFVEMGLPVLGIEPSGHAAEIANAKGVETRVEFFGEASARALVEQGIQADLMAANNVLAHVPDIRDFATGFAVLLKPTGVATFEFPHLAKLLSLGQFDTIYHEHYSYLSLVFVERLLKEVGLCVFDVDQLSTHGGSLRVYACHPGVHAETPAVQALRDVEQTGNLSDAKGYEGFAERVKKITSDLRVFLEAEKAKGKRIVGYGAAAKGNTFLNVAGIGAELIDFVVDRNPEKRGTFLPGSHIPVRDPAEIIAHRPDYLLILPWNIKNEVMTQQAGIRDWDGKFVTAVPKLAVT